MKLGHVVLEICVRTDTLTAILCTSAGGGGEVLTAAVDRETDQ